MIKTKIEIPGGKRKSTGELMLQSHQDGGHPAEMSVAELMKQGKPKRHAGQGRRSVKDLMHQ